MSKNQFALLYLDVLNAISEKRIMTKSNGGFYSHKLCLRSKMMPKNESLLVMETKPIFVSLMSSDKSEII